MFMAQKRGHLLMPTVSQLSRYMSQSAGRPSQSWLAAAKLQGQAAMPTYSAQPLEALEVEQPKVLKFADHVRIVKETGFG